jgi:hypothetical protein
MRTVRTTLGVLIPIVLVLAIAGTALAQSGTFSLFGTATVFAADGNPPPSVLLTSTAAPATFGGVKFTPAGALTVAQVEQLSTDFKVVTGNCGGGSPRFEIQLANGKNIFVYIGAFPNFDSCLSASWQTTGDLTAATDERWDISQLVAGGQQATYAEAVEAAGSVNISAIVLVVDAGWKHPPAQSFLVDNVTVNENVFSPAAQTTPTPEATATPTATPAGTPAATVAATPTAAPSPAPTATPVVAQLPSTSTEAHYGWLAALVALLAIAFLRKSWKSG